MDIYLIFGFLGNFIENKLFSDYENILVIAWFQSYISFSVEVEICNGKS